MAQIGQVIGTKMLEMKRVEQYPILHHFLARLYRELDVFSAKDMLAYIADDTVSSYCKCKDKGCASFFMTSDRELDLSAEDGVYVYDSDKGTIVLEFFENGDIDVQALEYEHYPFKEELRAVYNDEEEAQQKPKEIQNIVNGYFNEELNILKTINIE